MQALKMVLEEALHFSPQGVSSWSDSRPYTLEDTGCRISLDAQRTLYAMTFRRHDSHSWDGFVFSILDHATAQFVWWPYPQRAAPFFESPSPERY